MVELISALQDPEALITLAVLVLAVGWAGAAAGAAARISAMLLSVALGKSSAL